MSGASLKVEPALKPKLGIVDRFTKWSLNWVPNSMVFVSALTIIVFIMGMVFTDHSPLGLLDDYAKGFWLLLTFAMQLTVMMITGFVVAEFEIGEERPYQADRLAEVAQVDVDRVLSGGWVHRLAALGGGVDGRRRHG